MPNDELKKSNDSNNLERCPRGTDVGLFGRAERFQDNILAGFIYAAAIEELIKQTEEINAMLAGMDDEERQMLLPTLEKDLEEIDQKWIIATAIFGIDA